MWQPSCSVRRSVGTLLSRASLDPSAHAAGAEVSGGSVSHRASRLSLVESELGQLCLKARSAVLKRALVPQGETAPQLMMSVTGRGSAWEPPFTCWGVAHPRPRPVLTAL